jgi:dTDP-4-amino-4,6-dideoxygalactose transaminase
VQTLIHYPIAIHDQPPTRNLRMDPAGLPNAEAHAAQCLSIPCHPQMDEAAVNRVIEALNCFQ